jgi:hypothetical protein
MLMRTFNGMLESYQLLMSVGFVRHHSPFAISYIWFTTTPGYWLSDTASPAVKSRMFHFTLFWYGDWNSKSGLSVQTKHFHVFFISLKHGTFLAPIFGAECKLWSSSLRNFFLFFCYFSPFGQRTLFSTSFSPIMKELLNDNYENFARRKITFMKIYMFKLKKYICICVQVSGLQSCTAKVIWCISAHQIMRNIEYDVFSVFSHAQIFGLITDRTRVLCKLQ